MNYSNILSDSNLLKDRIISHRRVIHSFAETGFDTVKTASYIKDELSSMGIKADFISKNAVIAEINGKNPGKTFLLRSDMDALPITEESNLDFASNNGYMHACGHDMHAAMLLASASLLMKYKDSFCGKAILLFQPAEELLQGAKAIIDSGFDTSCIDGAITLHVISPCSVETGKVILPKGGVDAPSADFFKITVNGKGCHGSSPWLGKDPIVCACNIITALDTLRAREVSAYFPFTLTVASLNAGSGYNVIPEKAEFSGSLRCFDEDVRSYVKERIEEICISVSAAYGCKSKIIYESGCPSLVINTDLCDRFENVLSDMFGKDKVIRNPKEESNSLKGSEDFAYFSQLIPSFTAAIPAGHVSDLQYSHQMHSKNVLFDEDALSVGCAVFTACALDFLK